jgi:DNA-binding PadR family transcriptional regulator
VERHREPRSIRRALDGLLERGLVEVDPAGPGARGRKVFGVTEAGRSEFHGWMTGDPVGPDAEVAVLVRLFFLGPLDGAERGPAMERALARLEAELADLEAIEVGRHTLALFRARTARLGS